MTLAYEHALQPYKVADITQNTTYARKISTYIQHVWTRKRGTYHPVYDMAHLPHDTYVDWTHLRTMSLALPVYKIYTGQSPPFESRTSSFGCTQPGDLLHLLTSCPYTTTHLTCSRSCTNTTPSTIRDLFDADKYDLHDIVHNATYPVYLVRGTMSTLSALGEAAEP